MKRLVQECEPAEHHWQPVPDVSTHPDKWTWRCTVCHRVEWKAPSGATAHIGLKDLEALVDSSCSKADRVIEDNQSVRGDLWWMRNAIWVYRPYSFQIVYHVYHGHAFVMLFRHRSELDPRWYNIIDTDKYRSLLDEADVWRRLQP